MTSHPAKLRVGLTGGVASGKSTVAELFRRRGIAVIDADTIAREVTAPGSTGLHMIRDVFGAALLRADGTLDRQRLRGIVFSDPLLRHKLEEILHPLIRQRMERALERAEGPYVIVMVPLLVESGMGDLVDRIAVVDVSPELQMRRLAARDGSSDLEARSMIAAQSDRATRRAAAHDLIPNEGSEQALEAHVERLHAMYLEFAKKKSRGTV